MKALLVEDIDYEIAEKIAACAEKTMLVIDSGGGNGAAARAIIDILKDTPEKFVLVAAGRVDSAAFEIFLSDHGCKRVVYPHSGGMYHLATQSLSQHPNGVSHKTSKKYSENQPEILEEQLALLKRVGFSEEQTESFLAGEDVEISSKELRDFVERVEKPSSVFIARMGDFVVVAEDQKILYAVTNIVGDKVELTPTPICLDAGVVNKDEVVWKQQGELRLHKRWDPKMNSAYNRGRVSAPGAFKDGTAADLKILKALASKPYGLADIVGETADDPAAPTPKFKVGDSVVYTREGQNSKGATISNVSQTEEGICYNIRCRPFSYFLVPESSLLPSRVGFDDYLFTGMHEGIVYGEFDWDDGLKKTPPAETYQVLNAASLGLYVIPEWLQKALTFIEVTACADYFKMKGRQLPYGSYLVKDPIQGLMVYSDQEFRDLYAPVWIPKAEADFHEKFEKSIDPFKATFAEKDKRTVKDIVGEGNFKKLLSFSPETLKNAFNLS